MVSEDDRIELISTDDPHTNVESGDRGTVTGTDTIPGEVTGGSPEKQVWVDWDDHGNFALLAGRDSFKVVDEDDGE